MAAAPGNDRQRERVYAADRIMWRREGFTRRPRMTIPELRAEVARCVESEWWRAFVPEWRHPAVIGHGISECEAEYDHDASVRGTLRFGAFARHRGVLAHELAHVASVEGEEDHGSEFCRRHLAIVEWLLGHRAARMLRDEYVVRNVWIG